MKERKKEAIENYINAYNNFDVEGMIKDLHDEVVFQNVSNGEVDLTTEGIELFQVQANSAKSFFSERKQSIEAWTFEGDCVKIEISYFGILAIDLPNGMKSGDTLQLAGHSAFQFEGEKIVRIVDES